VIKFIKTIGLKLSTGRFVLYFLSDVEQKQLLYQLLPTAREVGVSKELRGWNWHQPPLKPYFDNIRLPMYQVSSKYCPTNRDIYLQNVEKKFCSPTSRMIVGTLFHSIVSDCLQNFRQRLKMSFDDWWQKNRQFDVSEDSDIFDNCRQIWDFMHKMCSAQIAELSCSQPYASELDLLGTAVPFLVEHKLSGELLGLSGILSVDCFDYLRTIMFDLKVSSLKEDWHRLYSLGYALVFESIHEVPIDICCTVYLN